AVVLRAVLDLTLVDAQARLLRRDEEAARDLELRIEQLLHSVEGERLRDDGIIVVPTGGGVRMEQPAPVAKVERHLLESERRLDTATHGVQDRVRRVGGGQRRRDLEELLETGAMPRSALGLLRRLDRDRRVLGERDEHLDLVRGRTLSVQGLAHREDSENPSLGIFE